MDVMGSQRDPNCCVHECNQVVVFVKAVQRAIALDEFAVAATCSPRMLSERDATGQRRRPEKPQRRRRLGLTESRAERCSERNRENRTAELHDGAGQLGCEAALGLAPERAAEELSDQAGQPGWATGVSSSAWQAERG